MNTDIEIKKMRLWKKVLIGVGSTLVLFGIIIGIILIWKISWVLFYFVGGISSMVWIIISTVLIYKKLSKKEPELIKVNLEDIEELVKYKMKTDESNPDNFIIKERRLWKIGEPGSERTPIRVFIGYGTELMKERIVLINLKNTNEMVLLIDSNLEEALKEAIKMAEHQPDIVTRDIIPGGIDEFGKPMPTRVRITSQSRAEAKEEKEKEEAEKQTAF